MVHGKSHRWRTRLALGTLLVVVLLCGLLLLPFSPLRKTAKQQFVSWLISRGGRGTSIGDVHLSLKHVSATDVVLPLGSRGSEIRIKQLDVALDLYQLLNQPDQFERTIRRIQIPSLRISLAEGDSTRQTDRPWIPEFKISRQFYSILGRLDSLDLLEFDDAQVMLNRKSGRPLVLCTLRGDVLQTSGTFHLAATGTYLSDARDSLQFSGEIMPSLRKLQVECTAAIPRGRVLPELKLKQPIETDGGNLQISLAADDSATTITGIAAITSLADSTPIGVVRAEDLIVHFAGDSLALKSCTWMAPGIGGPLRGCVKLRGAGELSFSGFSTVPELTKLPWLLNRGVSINGGADIQFEVEGDFPHPVARFHVTSPQLSWQGTELTDVRTDASIDSRGLHVESASAMSVGGRINLGGSLQWGTTPSLAGEARFDLNQAPKLSGWKSELQHVCASVNGAAAHPEIDWQFLTHDGVELGRATARQVDSVWSLDVTPRTGRIAHASLQPWNEGIRASVENPDGILSLLFGPQVDSLNPCETLHMQFTGDLQAGDVECTATVKPDSASLWSQALQTLFFSGRYKRATLQQLDVSGTWTGLNGNGEPFEGQASLTFADSMLTITHLFVDVIGNITGWVDLRERTLNLDGELSGLEFRRLPIRPSFMRRLHLDGKLAGHVHVEGELAKPEWTASVAATNVSLGGLENYWMNAEATGQGLQAHVNYVELGREVRRILSISGTVDGDTKEANLTAEASAVNAEDLLAAVVGKEGIVSGQLVGNASLRGALAHPELVAHIAIGAGKLLNSVAFDTLDAQITAGADSGRMQTVRISRVLLSKGGKYEFAGKMTVVPAVDSVQIHVAGDGDFLDIVDQLDKTFASLGSTGHFSLDLGGTFANLRIENGELSVSNGRFSYTDMTPNEVETDIKLRLAAPGVMDSGYVRFAEGARWLNLRLDTAADAKSEPLIIPKPALTLGVIEIETGETGMLLRLPGLMKPEWSGSFAFGNTAGGPVSISGFGAGRLLIRGNAAVDNARFTYPLISGGGGHPKPVAQWLLNRLNEARWDMNVSMGSGDHYDVTITGLRNSPAFGFLNSNALLGVLTDYLDKLRIDAVVSPSDQPLHVVGTLADHSFRVSGETSAERGKVEFLDQTFDVDYARADFDETSEFPIVEGRAETMGEDSLGRRVPVYLTMYQIDRETNTRQKRGRLENATFVLESESASSSEETLALLGLTPTQVEGTAGELVARTAARTLARQVLGPIERRIEKWTWLDEVTLSPSGGSRAVGARLQQQQNRAIQDSLQQGAAARFLTGSQFTLGKYVTPDLFVTYTGELAAGPAEARSRLGLIHNWNLEYRMKPLSRDLVLDLVVEYDAVERKRDETVAVKYSFPLEP